MGFSDDVCNKINGLRRDECVLFMVVVRVFNILIKRRRMKIIIAIHSS